MTTPMLELPVVAHIMPERDGEYHGSDSIHAYRSPKAGWEPLCKVSDAIAAIEAATLAAAPQWLPIADAPKDGTEILLFARFDVGLCYWRDDDVMTGWTWGLGKRFNNPSHWMPKPLPPTATQQGSI